jgi:hypothetical protein
LSGPSVGTFFPLKAVKNTLYGSTFITDAFKASAWATFRDPSPALKAYVGPEVDGNANWTHDLSGKTLRVLIASIS